MMLPHRPARCLFDFACFNSTITCAFIVNTNVRVTTYNVRKMALTAQEWSQKYLNNSTAIDYVR